MNEKTLYVSDLDGTLLNSNQRMSEYSIRTINALVEQGMLFSNATARSFVTAGKITEGISPKIPVIVYNGAFILRNNGQERILSNYFVGDTAAYVLEVLCRHNVFPIVYSYLDGVEKYSYSPSHVSSGMAEFLESRAGDIREHPTQLQQLGEGEIFYFTCIDRSEKLLPLYALLKNDFQCVYQKDIYSGEQWLEIMPQKATKANAALQLKQWLGCSRIICFGDGKNDISMFQIADECYAVENADNELKALATGVIASNNADGVANWLRRHYAG